MFQKVDIGSPSDRKFLEFVELEYNTERGVITLSL